MSNILEILPRSMSRRFFYGHLMLSHNNEFKDILLPQRQHSDGSLTPVNVNGGSFICVADMGQGIVVKED